MGCQSRNDQVDLTSLGPITLTEAYPGSILNVDKVELMDGSSGDIRRIEDRKVIQQWIAQIKDLELLPDDNQEGLVGYRFGIRLFEGEEMKLGFIPNEINNIYYKTNTKFDENIRAFFEEQFGRGF